MKNKEEIVTIEKTTDEIIEILETNGIPYSITACDDCDSFCVTINIGKSNCKTAPICVQACDKDIMYRIYPSEIVYIAIEKRKSVLYLQDKIIETNYPISYWTDILDSRVFAQPHYSFIVNLSYVRKITKDAIILSVSGKEISVYASLRKLKSFKETFDLYYNQADNN